MSETQTSAQKPRPVKDYNLLGKDFFNEKEAAHYCGVSLSQFRAKAAENGISSRKFMGKWVYRRDMIKARISSLWE